jgi:beta-glucanase (GH16 family)
MLADRIATVGWPQCGEIDIMEVVGHQPHKLHGTLHGPGYSGPKGISSTTTLPNNASLADNYHVYAIDWTRGRIAWSLDGKVYAERTPADLPEGAEWVFDDAPYFLLLNLAVGGYWPLYPDETTTFPQEFRIDYVRVHAPADKRA